MRQFFPSRPMGSEHRAPAGKTCYFKAELKLKMSSGNRRYNDATITWHVFPHFKKKLKIYFWETTSWLQASGWVFSFGQHLRTSITSNLYKAHVRKVAATAVALALHLCAYRTYATTPTVGHLQLGSNLSITITVLVYKGQEEKF